MRGDTVAELPFTMVNFSKKMAAGGCMSDSPFDSFDHEYAEVMNLFENCADEVLIHDVIGDFETAVDERSNHVLEHGRENVGSRRASAYCGPARPVDPLEDTLNGAELLNNRALA